MDIKNFRLIQPPEPNLRIEIGNGSNYHLVLYCEKPPNSIQRWFIRKLFGITLELI